MNQIKVVNEQTVLGKNFKIYGDFENPLVLRTKDCLRRENTATFLTENGLYEVLMLLRKSIAKLGIKVLLY